MIRAVLPNPNKILSPGQFVRVRIHGATGPMPLLFPRGCAAGTEWDLCFCVDQGTRLRCVILNLAPGMQTIGWYMEDLKAGDKVIVGRGQ